MKKAEELADGLVRQFGTSSPFELCDYLRIRVLRSELPESVRGLSFQQPQDGGSVILLNRGMGVRESRYCCAHELGHVLLHPGLNAQAMSDLTDLCVPKLEHEADFFAGCLMIGPSFEEWSSCFDPLSEEQLACLSGLPRRVASLWCETERKLHSACRAGD